MDALQELMSQTCGQIAEAHGHLMDDIAILRERHQDWMVRDFEIRVRWARYTLETADLERQRMSLLRTMATAKLAKPVVIAIQN